MGAVLGRGHSEFLAENSGEMAGGGETALPGNGLGGVGTVPEHCRRVV